MAETKFFYEPFQEVFELYQKNDRYLRGAIDGLSRAGGLAFILTVLIYEYENMERKYDKSGENLILPENLKNLLNHSDAFDAFKLFYGKTESQLEDKEQELYDDPSVYGFEEYLEENNINTDGFEYDEDEHVERWVKLCLKDQYSFLFAMNQFYLDKYGNK